MAFSDTDFFILSENECSRIIDHYFPGYNWQNKLVLDAGCRFGEFSNEFAKRGAIVTAIDLDENCIRKAQIRYPHLKDSFKQGNLAELKQLKSDQFDIVFCLGVLPYVPPDFRKNVADSFNRIIKSDGKILQVYQRSQSWLHHFVSKVFSIMPMPVYRVLVIKLLTSIMYPFSEKILGRKMSKERFIYIFGYGLRNIYFGYPDFLSESEVNTAKDGLIDPSTSISFMSDKSLKTSSV